MKTKKRPLLALFIVVAISAVVWTTAREARERRSQTNIIVNPVFKDEYLNWCREMLNYGVDINVKRINTHVKSLEVVKSFNGLSDRGIGHYDRISGRVRFHESVLEYDSLKFRWLLWHELGHGMFKLHHEDSKIYIMHGECPEEVTPEMWNQAKKVYLEKAKKSMDNYNTIWYGF